jgi:hypothetical protein
MFEITVLVAFIQMMMSKVKPEGQPGYLHFRVLCDYIRDAVARQEVTWEELNLSGELELCKLELECLEFGVKETYKYDSWIREALVKRIVRLEGGKLTPRESADVIMLFPEEQVAA